MKDFSLPSGVCCRRGLGVTLAASLLTLSACATPTPEASNADSVSEEAATAVEEAVEETVAQADTESNVEEESDSVWATGSFEGRSDHVVSGGVEVIAQDGKHFIQLGEDFSLDNAPDPKVGLGSDGYDPTTKSGDLVALAGASSYEVPAGVDVESYNEVYIWCEKFNVPLGVAQLQTQ